MKSNKTIKGTISSNITLGPSTDATILPLTPVVVTGYYASVIPSVPKLSLEKIDQKFKYLCELHVVALVAQEAQDLDVQDLIGHDKAPLFKTQYDTEKIKMEINKAS